MAPSHQVILSQHVRPQNPCGLSHFGLSSGLSYFGFSHVWQLASISKWYAWNISLKHPTWNRFEALFSITTAHFTSWQSLGTSLAVAVLWSDNDFFWPTQHWNLSVKHGIWWVKRMIFWGMRDYVDTTKNPTVGVQFVARCWWFHLLFWTTTNGTRWSSHWFPKVLKEVWYIYIYIWSLISTKMPFKNKWRFP